MTNVSYAQNYEDVMLLRALHEVERGFYIDVGAQDPVNDSVTKMFYQRGWHGINVEPILHWYERLLADRPHDINLQLAVSDKPGQLHLFEVVDSGLSTTDPEFAQRHAQEGFRIRESDVSCVTLDHICELHGVIDVHFLKIDCEGAEAAALRGISLDRVRPWIILLEATEPNSQKPAYTEWEPLLTQRGYRFAYADGLNRFYVADEHAALLKAFEYPPNVFDKFVRAPEASAYEHLHEVKALLDIATDARHLERLHAENERREIALVELRRVLEARDVALVQANEALTQAREMARHFTDEALEQQGKAIFQVHEIAELEKEIGRLHYAVAARDQEISRLNVALRLIHQSTSWRITAPLRGTRHALGVFYGVGRRLAYHLLRWPARLLRPLLRRIAQWSWLRSTMVIVAGQESRIVAKARLFLFGAPPSPHAQEIALSEVPLTRSAARVLEVIGQVRKQR